MSNWQQAIEELEALQAVHPDAVHVAAADSECVPPDVLRGLVDGSVDASEAADALASCGPGHEVGSSSYRLQLQLVVAPALPDTHADVGVPLSVGDAAEAQGSKPGTVDGQRAGCTDTAAHSEAGEEVVRLQHLPPVVLTAGLSETYPSHGGPVFALQASWLTPEQLRAAAAELVAQGVELGEGCPVLLTWLEWLRADLCEHLGLQAGLVVTERAGAAVVRSRGAVAEGCEVVRALRPPSCYPWKREV